MAYVVGFSERDVMDVTRRYVRDWAVPVCCVYKHGRFLCIRLAAGKRIESIYETERRENVY